MAATGTGMATVKMGDVWDRTTQVLSGRAGALAGIAVVTLLIPLVLMLAWTSFGPARTASGVAITSLLYLPVAVIGMLGALAMTALATEPATTPSAAWAQARARLLPLIGITVLLIAVLFLTMVPVIIILAGARVDMAALAGGGVQRLPSGLMAIVAIYYIVFLLALLWAGARLSVLNAVILHERLGIGAIRRSFALTRGITMKLIGVLLLYLVVMFVVGGAVQSVAGVVFRLILGADGVATAIFLAGVLGTIVTTIFSILAATFAAQLYVALTTRQSTTA